MRSLLVPLSLVLLALGGSLLAIPRVTVEREALRRSEGVVTLLPSSLYRVVGLEFKGLLADSLFSRTISFYGGKVIREERLTGEEWEWLYRSVDAATDLDPCFYDPYLFGAMTLTWEANRVDLANALLEKALSCRQWDWTIPFYLGFNHFYFLQDNQKAAAYLMQASERPGGGGVLAQLATRLLYQEKETENAIIFLREIIRKTEDERTRTIYQLRLDALEKILSLERSVKTYRERFGSLPADLAELVQAGIIREIPLDPYGGRFYLDAQGDIKTTSELRYQYK
jgi:tetratricopeptide (TPR) repeat protein